MRNNKTTKQGGETNGGFPRIDTMTVQDLKPADYNPRKISAESLGRLTQSMAEFGNLQPIVYNVRTKTVVGGHQRLKVMLARGDKQADVWCVDLDPIKEKAANLALNNLSGEWDRAGLETLIAELRDAEIDLDMTGVGSEGLDDLITRLRFEEERRAKEERVASDVEPKFDMAGELQKQWKTELGQMWKMGEHLLVCGDSTVEANWARMLGGEQAHMLWTDPPYGVSYESVEAARRKMGKQNNRKFSSLGFDDHDLTKLIPVVLKALQACSRFMVPGAPAYMACAAANLKEFIGLFVEAGFKYHRELLWVKNGFALSLGDYHYRHEPILYGWKKGAGHRWYGGHSQGSVFEFDKPLHSPEHPTMKPVGLLLPMIENSSRQGEIVLEPFGGAGSTMLACEQTQRKCRLVELNPGYCAVILQRYKDSTGNEPELIDAIPAASVEEPVVA